MTLKEAYDALKSAFENSPWVILKGQEVAVVGGVQESTTPDELSEEYAESFRDHKWTIIIMVPAVIKSVEAQRKPELRTLLQVMVCENPTEGTPLETLDSLQKMLSIPLGLPADNRTKGKNVFELVDPPNRPLSFESAKNGTLFHKLIFQIRVQVTPEST